MNLYSQPIGYSRVGNILSEICTFCVNVCVCPVSVVHRNALWHYLNSSSCQTTGTRGRNASHGGSHLCSAILCITIYGVVPVLLT